MVEVRLFVEVVWERSAIDRRVERRSRGPITNFVEGNVRAARAAARFPLQLDRVEVDSRDVETARRLGFVCENRMIRIKNGSIN